MYQCEALWMSFKTIKLPNSISRPAAIRVHAGGADGLSGQLDLAESEGGPAKRRKTSGFKAARDYVVVPKQPWLDGLVSSDSEVRQFVVKPLDRGETIESQIAGSDTLSGMQLEFTPSFVTNFTVVTGKTSCQLDGLTTPHTTRLSVGTQVTLEGDAKSAEIGCHTLRELVSLLGTGINPEEAVFDMCL
ncbi:hypothetical protein FRB95_011702 [Tulasnella sp. JGI-2019a]|nr:hypothetical protein FRB95_011702 [Tulasnella sp. JGI-2019a]